jgi:hypothetical protein
LRVIFNHLCTLADPHRTLDQYGEEIVTYTPTTDPALQVVRCYLEPATGAETRRATDVFDVVTFMVALDGYYPQIRVAQAVIVADKTYNITKVSHDDTNTQTYLTVEIVNPDAQTS